VLELLSVEGEVGLSTAELGHALGVEAGELSGTLSELGVAGVLEISKGSVRASAATLRLDELELIGI
jgi:predicted transcriptional regulator